MAVREIKTTLSLDGEKEFNRAISEAGRGMRVMASEIFQSTHPARGATAKDCRKPSLFLSLFHNIGLSSCPADRRRGHKDVFFSVRSSREIHECFGFALQIISTPSGA